MDVWEDDVLPAEPSGDEGIPPDSSDAPLYYPTYFSLPFSSLGPRLTAQSMRRPGDTLESGFTKEPRAERANPQQDEEMGPQQEVPAQPEPQRYVNMEDYGILPSNNDHIRLALAPNDIQNAIYLPVAGRPPFRVVFWM